LVGDSKPNTSAPQGDLRATLLVRKSLNILTFRKPSAFFRKIPRTLQALRTERGQDASSLPIRHAHAPRSGAIADMTQGN
jgi:hypothetical protein